MFKAMQKEGKYHRKGSIKHKSTISEEDCQCLQDYFSLFMKPDAMILQQLVMFNIIYYLYHHGRENFALMTRVMFLVSKSTFWI